MNPPSSEVINLPNGMLIFAFIASLLLTLIKIVEITINILRKPTLEIALTRETFFRILETGEALYVNSVIIAYDVGALITCIKVSLKKENGAVKDFPLKVSQIGEKYRGSEGLYQFSFHSSSPLAFIPEGNPLRQVYICEHESYAEATNQKFKEFQQKLIEIKERYKNIQETEAGIREQLLLELSNITNDACTDIMDKIQIEQGKYTLNVTVKYKQKGKYFPSFITKTAKSGIQFVVEEYARDSIRYSLKVYLENKSIQFLTNQNGTNISPEYSPNNIVELSAQ